MIKLLIFDYDGLMVNSEHVVYDAIKALFKSYQKDLTWEYYCRHIGTPVSEALENFHTDHALTVPLKEFIRARNEIVSDYLHSNLTLMPGLLPFLDFLKQRDVTLAIASSGTKEYVHSGLKKFAINSHFQAVVTIDDVKRGKPHPDLILKTLEVTGYKPHEALIIEDSPHGIEAARRAYVYSIAIPTKGVSYKHFQHANLIVKDFTDLQKIINL